MGELFDSVFLYFSGLLEVVLEIIFYGRFVGKRGTAIQNILFVVLGYSLIGLKQAGCQAHGLPAAVGAGV